MWSLIFLLELEHGIFLETCDCHFVKQSGFNLNAADTCGYLGLHHCRAPISFTQNHSQVLDGHFGLWSLMQLKLSENRLLDNYQ